jgi:hypothetical protein
MKTNIHSWSYLAQFFLEWKMFQTKFVDRVKTHFHVQLLFFRKSCCLWDNVRKYCTAGQRADDNIARAHCMLDILKHNQGDATFYNILYSCQCSTYFERFLRSSSGAQKLYMQHRVLVKLVWYDRYHGWVGYLMLQTLQTHTHTHTLRICNNYSFSTAAMVTRTRLYVTLCIQCLSC